MRLSFTVTLVALVALVASAALIGGCGVVDLRPVEDDVRIESSEPTEFGPTRIGVTKTRTVELRNVGRRDATVRLRVGDPFSVSEPEATVPAGALHVVTVQFTPQHAQTQQSILIVETDRITREHPVVGVGVEARCDAEPPACFVFVASDEGLCDLVAQPDGTACENGCLEQGATCLGGACTGQFRSCDDGDSCTDDLCDADATSASGCFHPPRACPATSPCRAAFCDPDHPDGCREAPVADGTACGASFVCALAPFCLDGECVARPVPDGTACSDPACEGSGTCEDGLCIPVEGAPPPKVIEFDWSHASYKGVGRPVISQAGVLVFTSGAEISAVEPSGNPSWSATGQAPLWSSARVLSNEQGDPERLHAWDGQTGMQTQSVSVEDLAPAGWSAIIDPPGKARVRASRMVIDPAGRPVLVVSLELQTREHGPWVCESAWLVTLHGQSLQVVSRQPLGTVCEVDTILQDGGGTVLVIGGGGVVTGAPAGGGTWKRPPSVNPVLHALMPGRAWLSEGVEPRVLRLIDTLTGALLATTELEAEWAAADANHLWAVGVPIDATGRVLARFDVRTGAELSVAAWPQGVGAGMPVDVTGRQTLLQLELGLYEGLPTDMPGMLRELDATGRVVSQCPIAAFDNHSNPVLADDRLYLIHSVHRGQSLKSFAVPDRRPPSHGFRPGLGDLAGRGRPH